jgi:hypothetical protein
MENFPKLLIKNENKRSRPEKKTITSRLRGTGQSRAVFERQNLTGSFYLYHSFLVIVARPLSSMFPATGVAGNRGADFVAAIRQ